MTNPPPHPYPYSWLKGGFIDAPSTRTHSLHSEDLIHTTENTELLEQVRLRIKAATTARKLLPDDATLGEILALAEWLMGGSGEQFLDSDDASGDQR